MSKLTRASIEAALNDPYNTLERLWVARGLGEIFHGNQPASIFGAAEGESPAGFISRADDIPTVPGQPGLTLDGQSVNSIWQEMQAMLRAFNRSATAVASYFSFRTTRERERVGVPVSAGFQEATEYGRPSKVRVEHVSRGFPLKHWDIGDGYTQEYIDKATGAQLLAVQTTIVNDWSQLRQELVLDSMFNDTNFTDKDEIAVKVLYNADGEVPPKIKRWTHDGTHTHYLTSAGASLVQADLDAMSEHLVHHGFREFGDATFILHVNRGDLPAVKAFANWIPAESGEQPSELAASGVLVGPRRRGGVGGFQVEGWVNDWTVVQNNDIPENYFVGHVSGGPFDSRNVVGLREHENASARGLRLIEGGFSRYPLIDSVYDGYTAAGIGQRGAAVILQETAGAYTRPTFDHANDG